MKKIKVVRKNGMLTVSQKHGLDAFTISNHQFNQIVGKLLSKLAEEFANEDEYEYDGVDEAVIGSETISLTAKLFIPGN